MRVTHNSIIGMMELAAARGADWRAAATAADQRSAQIGGSTVALAYENTDHVAMIDFRGYAYTREPSAISGGLATRYDNTHPQVWHIPLRDEVRPSITSIAPRGGYVVAPAHATWVGEKLALHGIQARTVTNAGDSRRCRRPRGKAAIAPASFEGRAVCPWKASGKNEMRDIPAGSLFRADRAARSDPHALFEPRDPDSFVAGAFNAAFERRSTWRRTWGGRGHEDAEGNPELKWSSNAARDDRAFRCEPGRAARLSLPAASSGTTASILPGISDRDTEP